MTSTAENGSRPDYGTREPYDLAAEMAALGAMLSSAAAAEACRQALVADDFYRPGHQLVFSAVMTDMREGITADAVTVMERLQRAGDIGKIRDATYLADLIAACPLVANAAHYARIIREHAIARRLRIAARRVLQMTEPDSDTDAHGMTEFAVREMEAVRDGGLVDGLTLRTIDEFLDVPDADDEYDWVIPGLLERGDRLMLTGAEGAGKSSLLRQMAVTTAAGIHPFRHLATQPKRVMLVDNENSERQMRRKLRPLIAQARLQHHPVATTNLWLEGRGPMDLANDKDVSWLLRQVATVNPDVVIIGPLAKLAPRALNSDDDVAPIIAALDMVRARGAALILEAHAGHALGVGGRRDWRPRGSSAWLGWPEFGYGLRWTEDPQGAVQRTVDMVSWRGDRDEREWPDMLTAGGVWPWKVYDKASAGWGNDA